MPDNDKEQKENLLNLVREAIRRDNELREKYQIGDKFRFVRDRLQALLSRLEQNLTSDASTNEQSKVKIAEDEVVVYVHLFNAQGIKLPTWQKMISPAVFYEYSVNRPIYTEKAHVEAFIRNKPNKAQHGFLSIAIKRADILKPATGLESAKDAIGHPLIKVKDGALHFDKFISFTHNNQEYVLNKTGELVSRPS